MPADTAVVDAAVTAAEDVIFARFDRAEIADIDVGVTYEAGVLDLDIYLDVPEAPEAEVQRVADDAALAARRAVDELFAAADMDRESGPDTESDAPG